MSESRSEATLPGKENQRLTAYLGADPSGWDTTQLLRVPGSANNKPDKPAGTRGRMVWGDREVHTWEAFEELPEVKGGTDVDLEGLSEELINQVDRHEAWARVRLKVKPQVREYMRAKTTDGLDRSNVAWQIERELADHGCSLAEMVAIIRPTIWNKFDGRQDELKRLMNECAKALAQKDPALSDDDGALEAADEDEVEKPKSLLSFQEDDSFLNAHRPRWLVRDLWIEDGVGFIAGAPKSMKSWMALHLAFAVATRTPYWEHSVPRARNVLYIQQEDDKTTVKDRLGLIIDSQDDRYHWAGTMRYENGEIIWYPPVPAPKLLSIQVQTGFVASNPGWQSWLSEMVAAHDIGLVVMDTLMTVSGGIDTDNAREIKSMMLDPLKVISREHHCAMILVHHNTKAGQNNRGAMNMAGSGQIHAWADCGIYVHERDGNILKVEIENKFGANRTTHVSLESLTPTEEHGRGVWLPREIVREETGTGTRTSRRAGDTERVKKARAGGWSNDESRNKAHAANRARGDATYSRMKEYIEGKQGNIPSFRVMSSELDMSLATISKYMRRMREESDE